MRRREIIKLIACSTAAWPFAALAQQTGKVFHVGFWGVDRNAPGSRAIYQKFVDELQKNGFEDGRNLTIDYRRIDDPRGLSIAAAELLHAHLDLIVVEGPEAVLKAVIEKNHSIPIVLQAVNFDPVTRGYVASLARPGGNITGVFYRQVELAAKKLELLAQAVPNSTSVGILWDALVADEFNVAEHTAKSLRLSVHAVKLENPPYDFVATFRTIAQTGVGMLLVVSSPLFALHRKQIAQLAIEYRLPAMFIFKSYVYAGGLMSYGVDQVAMFRRIADFVAKILKGAKPADIPLEEPTKFELVINLKTAKVLGLKLSPELIARADDLIE